MAGESLREGIVEVAFEQWTERQTAGCRKRQRSVGGMPADAQVGSNVFPALQGSGIGQRSRTGRVQRFSLNLGGNTDDTFALSIRCSGLFFTIRSLPGARGRVRAGTAEREER